MRNHKYYIIPIILSILFGITACNDTFEFHEKYTENGEQIYTNKIDSLNVLSGNKRIKIIGYISNAFNVKEIEVTWNKGKGKQVFPYKKSSNKTDKLELLIEGLEEQSYEFNVISRDKLANTSVNAITYATAYGETYRKNLNPRAIETFSFGNTGNALIELKPSDDLARDTEIKFSDDSGKEIICKISYDKTAGTLTNVDIDKPITYRTYYVPTSIDEETGEETSIDLFASDWSPFKLPSISSILESVKLKPILGGVFITWKNPSEQNIGLKFSYNVKGKTSSHQISSNTELGGNTLGGLEGISQTILVSISDAYGNSFGPIALTVTPIEALKFNKTDWEVISYSSQHPPKPATNIIDGNLNTFWHSEWKAVKAPYPHSIVVDMKSEKTISSFELFRWKNRSTGHTKHQFFVSTDNKTWIAVGTYTMKKTNAAQLNTLDKAIIARYFKYVAIEGPNYYDHLAEINVYGATK